MPRTRDREEEVGKATIGPGLIRPLHVGTPGRQRSYRFGGDTSILGTGEQGKGGNALISTALLSTRLVFKHVFLSTSSLTSSAGSMALTEATLGTTSSFTKSQLRPIQPRPWLTRWLL